MHGSALALIFLLATATPQPGPGSEAARAGGAARLRFSGDEIDIPMPRKAGRSLVEVRIGDSGPFDFLIDTGAGVSVIDSRIASDLGLAVVGDLVTGVPGGEQVKADRLSVPSLRIGALEILDATPIALDLDGMTGGMMQGVLGLDLFRDVLLTLDPAGGRAVVSRAGLEAGAPGVVRVDTAAGRLQFDMMVAGRKVPTQIDTGAPGGFTLPAELLDAIPTVPGTEQRIAAGLVGGTRQIRVLELDGSVRFAGIEYENPRVGFMDPSPGIAHIGMQILDELAISLDQRNGLLAFRRAKPSPSLAPVNKAAAPRRLGVRFRGSPSGGFTHVDRIDPGSLGEKAGFQAGDRLVSLNGRPMSAYDMATLGSLIRGTKPLLWVVERDGVRHDIEIP